MAIVPLRKWAQGRAQGIGGQVGQIAKPLASSQTKRGLASQVALVVKNPPANAGDTRDAGSIPGWGRFPEGGTGNPLQYSCLENPMDR